MQQRRPRATGIGAIVRNRKSTTHKRQFILKEMNHTWRENLKSAIYVTEKWKGFIKGRAAVIDKGKQVSRFRFYEFLSTSKPGKTVLAIRNLKTAPDYRQEDITRRLLVEFISFASQKQNLAEIELRVHPRNFVAIKLYRRLGFKPYERHLFENEKRSYIIMRYKISQ